MSSEYKVLMVDDEPNILSGYKRSLGRKYDLVLATGGQEGLTAIKEQGPFAVIITDMRMPGMDGLAFLRAAQAKNKRSVYAMLTGNADQQTAINAINEGRIFRFLNKPCPGEQLDQTIQACIHQFDLMQIEHRMLRDTVAGSIKLLTQTVSLSDPRIALVNEAVRLDTMRIAQTLQLPNDWRLSIAASLCLIGSAIADSGGSLGSLPNDALKRHAQIGANLIRNIPKLSEVAQIIERQRETGPMPDSLDMSDLLSQGCSSPRITICSRILRITVDFRIACISCENDKSAAFNRMRTDNPEYDTRLLDAYELIVQEQDPESELHIVYEPQLLPIPRLEPGMNVTEDVVTKDGKMLLVKGSTLTAVVIERLKELNITKLCTKEVSVLLPTMEQDRKAA
ncbi:MAG: response regulator [Phycisphaera sp.]|nr:MAG: response regulator [Phycisphaera sp.]